MKRKILILGSTGMLGHQVFYNLIKDENLDVFDLSYRNKLRPETIICDVTDFGKLSQIISGIKPNVIVNCIGVLIKGAKENPKNAILLNSFLPHWLADEADQINAKLIHISTDCVFSGNKGEYSEDDFRDADDVYGRSKALGEVCSEKHLTIRTSIIGPELKENGEGLFHWFMNQDGNINGYSQAFWGGVSTLECARAINSVIFNDINGIINLTNGEKISKYEMLIHFKRFLKKDEILIIEYQDKIIDKSLLSIRSDFDFKVPNYPEMFYQMIEQMIKHHNLYPHYNF